MGLCHSLRNIDGRILTLRSIFFFQTTAGSSISRFLIVFLKQHFNAAQLGLLLGIRPGVGFFSAFLWGFIGDFTGKHLLCLILGLIVAVVSINGLVISTIGTNFWFAMINLNVVTIFGASGCLLEAIVLLILGEDKNKKKDDSDSDSAEGTKEYGATRMWGAVGWGFGSCICGALIGQFGEIFLFYFYDCTYSIVILIIIISGSYLTISKDNQKEKIIKNTLLNTPVASDMLSSPPQFHQNKGIQKISPKKDDKNKLETNLFKQSVFTLYGFIFFFNLLLFGTCMAFVENYLFLFLLDEFDATDILCGLTIGVMVMGEIPIFYFSKWFINKIGIIGLLSIAHFAYSIRCIGYILLPETRYYSWFILCIEPLHGLTFGGMWIASVELGSQLTPKSMQGTMQGLICGIYQGLASCFGTVLGGWLYHTYGPKKMYQWAAIAVAAWGIFFQISLRLIRCFKPSKGIKLIFSEKIQQSDDNTFKSIDGISKTQLLINEEQDVFINDK